MVDSCPTCGATIPIPEVVYLTPTQHKIYIFVAKHPKCSIKRIFSHLYHDRSDGGPLSTGTIHVSISRINKILIGHKITASHRGQGSTYSLKRTEDQCQAQLPV